MITSLCKINDIHTNNWFDQLINDDRMRNSLYPKPLINEDRMREFFILKPHSNRCFVKSKNAYLLIMRKLNTIFLNYVHKLEFIELKYRIKSILYIRWWRCALGGLRLILEGPKRAISTNLPPHQMVGINLIQRLRFYQ